MKTTIEILVSPTGDVSIDAIGFSGPDCENATRYLEEALGAVNTRNRKPEYQQRQKARKHQRIGT